MITNKITKIIQKRFKVRNFDCFLSISDEKDYSTAFTIIQSKMKLDKNFFSENIRTLLYALIIAIIIRSLLIQPFYIPSSSMEPTLLVGDRLFVTKYSYGYSKHSFPFSPPILNKEFYLIVQKEEMLLYLKHLQTIGLII